MKLKYNVGDIVKIKQLSIDDDQKYRYGLNNEMVKQSGKTFEIATVSVAHASSKGKLSDDGYSYGLKGIGWSWVTSMFEDPSEVISLETSVDNNLDAFIAKKKRPELDFTL